MSASNAIDYDGLIPNNVGLSEDLRVRRALETWHPGCQQSGDSLSKRRLHQRLDHRGKMDAGLPVIA